MTKEISLTRGKVTIVDKEDFEWLNQWKWYCSVKGYAIRNYNYKDENNKSKQNIIFMHREIIKAPKVKQVDHINRTPLDNRKINLRICDNKHNMRNKTKISGIYSSKYKGVSWDKQTSSWHAYIGVDNNLISLGYFTNEHIAAKAHNEATIKYHKEYACPNNISSEWTKEDIENYEIIKREVYKRTKEDYKGVGFHKSTNRWRATIWINKIPHHIGSYLSKNEAALAYNEKAIEIFGNKAIINGIKEEYDSKIDLAIKNTTSKYIGVHKHRNKWVASIKINNKSIYIGSYSVEEEAAKAYNNYIKENNIKDRKINEC